MCKKVRKLQLLDTGSSLYLPYSFLLLYAWWKENMWAMIPDQERKYNSEAQ